MPSRAAWKGHHGGRRRRPSGSFLRPWTHALLTNPVDPNVDGVDGVRRPGGASNLAMCSDGKSRFRSAFDAAQFSAIAPGGARLDAGGGLEGCSRRQLGARNSGPFLDRSTFYPRGWHKVHGAASVASTLHRQVPTNCTMNSDAAAPATAALPTRSGTRRRLRQCAEAIADLENVGSAYRDFQHEGHTMGCRGRRPSEENPCFIGQPPAGGANGAENSSRWARGERCRLD